MLIVTDFLDDRRKEIIKRLSELKPLVEEYHRLEAAVAAMRSIPAAPKGTSSGSPRTTRGRRGPGRSRGSVNRSSKRASKATPAARPAPAAGATPVATPVLTPPATPPSVTPVTAARKKPGRPPRSGRQAGGSVGGSVGRPKGRGGRPKGSGKRAAEALSLVRGQPGITIPELAVKMGIKQNYLYRVLPGLEQDGKLEKQGRGWHPKGA